MTQGWDCLFDKTPVFILSNRTPHPLLCTLTMPILDFQNIGPVGSGSVNATFGNKAAPAKTTKKGD